MEDKKSVDGYYTIESGSLQFGILGQCYWEWEEIMEEEPCDNDLSPKLYEAINHYLPRLHEAERGGGRIPDGGDEFIEELKQVCGGTPNPQVTAKVTLSAEDLRIVLTTASLGCAIANEDDPETVEMVERCQTILHKICDVADDNKTYDLLVR